MSLFLNCESSVIDTIAKAASLLFTVSEIRDHGLPHMVSDDSTDHEHGLPALVQPNTQTHSFSGLNPLQNTTKEGIAQHKNIAQPSTAGNKRSNWRGPEQNALQSHNFSDNFP